MKTLQFHFEPDATFPQFKRIAWDVVPVSVTDVLDHGIHPWEDSSPYDLLTAFQERLNCEEAKPLELAAHNLTGHVSLQGQASTGNTGFIKGLEALKHNVLFVDALSFEEVLRLAKNRLRDSWTSGTALSLAERLHPNFQDLRRFLKEKDKSVKLSGYGDLHEYDWSTILSLEDFANHEYIVLERAISPLNFRTTASLGLVSDTQGRLKLKERMEQFRMTQPANDNVRTAVTWYAKRRGDRWELAPGLLEQEDVRHYAKAFAERWGHGSGRICFQATTQTIADIVGSGEGRLRFPALRCGASDMPEAARAGLPTRRVVTYNLGAYPTAKCRGEDLKDLLREYEAPMTGNKEALVQRVADVAAEEYRRLEPRLDATFRSQRYARVAALKAGVKRLAVLEDEGRLTGLVLHMYALRHLRGNVIVDPEHLNEGAELEITAQALMSGQVRLDGAFVEII